MKFSPLRSSGALLGVAIGFAAVCAAIAGGTAVADRQATMKHVGLTMKQAAAFTSGQPAFDKAKVKSLMDVVATDAKKLKTLYPADSMSDPKTAADPKIWLNKADFNKRLDTLSALAIAAGSARDAATFAPTFKSVGDTCKSCHDVYRVKKNL